MFTDTKQRGKLPPSQLPAALDNAHVSAEPFERRALVESRIALPSERHVDVVLRVAETIEVTIR